MVKMTTIESVKNVKIEEHQMEHFNRCLKILKTNYGYLDGSLMGTGKTDVTLGIAEKGKWKIFIVSIKSGMKMWINQAKKYGIEIIDIISYEAVNLVKGREKTNKYLRRNDKGKIETKEKFDEYVKDGMLLIFDEVQKIKNNTGTLESCHALVKSVVKHSTEGARSRIALLSATAIDATVQIISLIKMLGVVTEDEMYKYDRKNKQYLSIGFDQLQQYCSRFNKYRTQYICSEVLDRKSIYTMCKDLYFSILKDQLTSSMPALHYMTNIKNGYYEFEPDDLAQMKESLELLKTGVEYNEETKTVKYHSGWGKIPIVLRKIEKAKVGTAIRLAKEILDKSIYNKVILFFRYRENVEKATALLQEYGALHIYGPDSPADRLYAQKKFQEPNTDVRAVVLNTQVAGMSIELDDQIGGFTRYTFMIPNHRVNEQFQALYRGGGRKNSKSENIARFIYSKTYPEENSIIHAMTTKGKMFRLLSNDHNYKIKYPNEYDIEIEGVSPDSPEYFNFLQLWSQP